MGFTPEYCKYGDFDYLFGELKEGEKKTVLCEGCGWITYRKIRTDHSSWSLKVTNVIPEGAGRDRQL